jgi:hypothetical protein
MCILGENFGADPIWTKKKIIQGFKPFDRVLVRNTNDAKWRARHFASYTTKEEKPDYWQVYPYIVSSGAPYQYCIPYEGNEALMNTTFDPSQQDTPQDKFNLIEIKSRPGTFVKLDTDVADKIGGWGWWLNENGYAMAHLPGSGGVTTTGKRVFLSRAVIWAATGQWPAKGMQVDHINHNPLDNRIENLRVVTESINRRNQLKRKGTVSKYKGVYFDKRLSKKQWTGRVCLKNEGKVIIIHGSATSDETIAAMCYDCLCDLIGGFLLPNFPHMTFKEKWQLIGEGQRNQILHSLTKHGIQPRQ